MIKKISQAVSRRPKVKKVCKVRSLEELSKRELGIYAKVSFHDIYNTGLNSVDEIVTYFFERSSIIEEQPSSYEILGYCDDYVYISDCTKFQKTDDLFVFLEYLDGREFRGYKILDKTIETSKVVKEYRVGRLTYLN